MGQVDCGAEAFGRGKSLIVIGINSPNYRIYAHAGEITKEGVFVARGLLPARIAGTAQEGYLVAQASPGDVLGITLMERLKSPTDASGEPFYLCTHPKAVVFQVPTPGIYYLGDLEYTFRANGRVLEMQQGQQIQPAREHLKRFYPNLSGELQSLRSDLRSGTGESCAGYPKRITIPIYIR